MTNPSSPLPPFPSGELLDERERFARLGSLLSGMIHNLNNPLNAVMGIAQLMELRLPDDKDIPRLLKYVDVLADQLRDLTSKVQFEERLPRIDDLPAWLEVEMRFFQVDLGFKHGVAVEVDIDRERFPSVDVPALPMSTWLFRFIHWLDGVVDHHQKASLRFSAPEPDEPLLLMELHLIEPEARTATELNDLVDLINTAGIACELEISSDTDLSWRLRFPVPAESEEENRD